MFLLDSLPFGDRIRADACVHARSLQNTLITHTIILSVMKKTPFLSYILAALLACSAAPQAYGYDEEISDGAYALTDWEYPDEDFVPNVLNVGADADDESDDYWGDVVMDDPIYVWSTNGIITNGSVSCPVYIFEGGKLTLAAAQDGLRAADLVYWSGEDIDLSELDDDEKVKIYMYNNSTLDYRDKDVRLGRLTTYSGDTVYIQCGNLVTEEFGSTWDFTINAKIQLKDSNSHLWIARYTKSVTLNCEQNMNLVVGDDRAYIYDGQYYGVSGDGCKLNGSALHLPDNKTSIIYGYLGGTSTITLGNGTILQGRYEPWDNGRGAYISWLLNDIQVNVTCHATMQNGYYGGTIYMLAGSSLKFDMDVVPAGVDPDHLEGGAKVIMYSGTTLDLAGRTTPLDLTVKDSRNTVKNGTLIGTLTLEAGSSLVSHSAMASWDGPTSIVMKNGSTLEMATGFDENLNKWLDCWINDVSKLTVEGTATVVNAYLRIKPGTTYTLGNGVQNLVGEGQSFLSLDNSTLDLAKGEISKLDIRVWPAFAPYENVIKNGTLNTYVEIDPSAKLWLDGVTLGDNASFTMGNNTQLDMGGASIKLSKISLAASSTAKMDNVTLDLGDGTYTVAPCDTAACALILDPDSSRTLLLGGEITMGNGRICTPGEERKDSVPMEYTLSFTDDGTPSYIEGNYIKLNLIGDTTFATNNKTRYLVNKNSLYYIGESMFEAVDNPNTPLHLVKIDVTAEGQFLFGKTTDDQGGNNTPVIFGDLTVSHNNAGPSSTATYDVDVLYRLIGGLKATMNGRKISVGLIGYEDDPKENWDKTIVGGKVTVGGASEIEVTSFIGQSMELAASELVTLKGNGRAYGYGDGTEEVTALKDSATLVIGGVEEDRPEINFQANLSAHTIALTGTDISGTGSYGDARDGATFVEFADSCTINATGIVNIQEGFKGGVLTVEGGGNVVLDLLGISEDAPLAKANITSNGGDVVMRSFTGGALKADANGAVIVGRDSESGYPLSDGSLTPGGNITATEGGNAVELKGSSVRIRGELTATAGSNFVKSTSGDITIGDSLSAGESSTLDSAANIKVTLETSLAKTSVTGGNLTATAGDSITMKGIDIGGSDAELTAGTDENKEGKISAGAFTGGTLKAIAKGALTFNGDVEASGDSKWQPTTGGATTYAVVLEGSSVNVKGSLTSTFTSTSSAGRNYIKSTGGDITIAGNMSAKGSSFLDSEGNITIGTLDNTGNITAGGNVTGGNLTATAAQSILMGNIDTSVYPEGDAVLSAESGSITAGSFIGRNLTATAAQSILMGNIGTSENPVGDAELTAESGSITAGSFTGNTLKAIAKGALAFNGDVEASGDSKWQPTTGGDTTYAVVLEGYSVSVNGSLTSTFTSTSSAGRNYIKSTGGDITIAGDLSAKGSNILDSAGSITLGTLDEKGVIIDGGNVTGGVLTATAGDSILMKGISIGDKSAELTAGTAEKTQGNISAGAFTGGTLKAIAKGALAFNGDVEASGDSNWQPTTGGDTTYAVVLDGYSVSVNGSLTSTFTSTYSAGRNYIKSTGGDITIAGNMSAKGSSILDSKGNITIGTLDNTGNITAGGNVTGGVLTATAANSILMGNIGTSKTPVGDTVLTATGGSITAGDVTAGKLTASAAGSITLNKVVVSQSESRIVTTGKDGNVVLNSFSGKDALIKATQGSITVALGATGAEFSHRNTFMAEDGVTFNGATGVNSLSYSDIFSPTVNWAHGTTLTNVVVMSWAPAPDNNASGLLLAAVNVSKAKVAVGGSLVLQYNSNVEGDVELSAPTEDEQKVVVDHSTITGQVSGARELVLDSGGVGNVVVNESGDLTVTSSGNSDFYCVPRQEGLESLEPPVTVTQEIPTLILNGGSLTVSPATIGDSARLLVTKLTVKETTTLNSGLRLADSNDVLTFNVTEKNAVAWGGYAPGESPDKTLLTVNGPFTQAGGSFGISASIFLGDQLGNPKENLEKGMWYALMTLKDGKNPDWWDEFIYIESTTDGLVPTTDGGRVNREDLVWKDGTLYYMSGAELKAAIWAPTQESHQWNTADKNWLQDDVRYRYKDGVTTVFDDTAFQDSENNPNYEGEVVLESVYTPSDVLVNNKAENNYTFMGSGAIDGTTTTLTKDGEGTLTITNANTYSGGTIIEQGTLVVANAGALGSGDVTQVGGTLKLSFDGQTPDFGTVTLQGGTVQIDGGAKDFNLVVTGTEARIEGDADNAFIGSLTLEAGSHLVSAGSLASWDGPTSILMKNGSMLEMDPNCDIWINDITNLRVVGTATVKNAYLRINPHTNGGKYVLGNGVENLRGDGATAYCLDGSTFDLNDHTTNLNIIVWNAQDVKDNVVEYGTVDTKVDIHDASRLYLGSDVEIGDRATFFMGDTAYLNMGGRSSRKARLNVFSFTGASATIDNGTLLVEKTKDGSPLVLGTNLRGEKTYVALRQESTLDLNRHSLAVEAVKLDADAASATIGNGTVASGVVVDAGKALHLGAALNVTGAVSGSGTLVKNDDGGTAGFTGSMKSFTGNVEVQGGTLNLMNIAEAAQLNVADVAIMNGTLGVYKGETAPVTPDSASEGTLTISNSHTLAAGKDATLNANLVMQRGSTLDVSATEGMGLLMGSSVTLYQGMQLSANDMDAVRALGFMDKYDLFREADSFTIGSTGYEQIALTDQWVKASEIFGNNDFNDGGKEYYVFYSGATQGGNAGNVGTIYIMQIPEPATSTLSLLALAALAARRRRK